MIRYKTLFISFYSSMAINNGESRNFHTPECTYIVFLSEDFCVYQFPLLR